MTPEDLRSWTADFAARALDPDAVEAFVADVDAVILAQMPDLAADPVLVAELHASTRAHWRTFLAALPDPAHRLVLPEPAIALSRSLARRGEDIGVLLKIYRTAQRGVFEHLAAVDVARHAGPRPVARDEVLVALWDRASRWIDDAVEALIADHLEEQRRIRETTDAGRAEAIAALLRGEPAQARTLRALAHPLPLCQTALVLWRRDGDVPPAPGEWARAVRGALGATSVLTHLAGSRELWAWAATATPPEDAALDGLAVLLEDGVHLAVGRPEAGPTGFRRSHEQARSVQALMLGLPRTSAPPALLRHPEVELLCLTGTGSAVADLARRELGALLAPGRGPAQLRETLATHLACGLQVDLTARRLVVHPNTVRYRLARAEELLGRRLTERAGALDLALRYAALVGVPES
ncbi:PucR family transcriptional regulator [Nocardioides sp.]|uniref:PucR family transcriptional regulator n=1 Tax=Nocardioides sp. TaxID=35761 RepID=UPI0035151F38